MSGAVRVAGVTPAPTCAMHVFPWVPRRAFGIAWGAMDVICGTERPISAGRLDQHARTHVLPMRQRHSRGRGCWGARASSLMTTASRRGRQRSLAVIFRSPMGLAVTPCEEGRCSHHGALRKE
jgi:hypothetical protein